MDPITVALQQQGADEVKAALRSVQDAIVALDSFAASSARRAGRDRVRAVREEAQERRRLASSGKGSSQASNDVRAAFKRALGDAGGASVKRASSGPSIGEYAGLASSGMGSLMGTIGKFGAVGGAIALFKSGIDLATTALEQFGGFLISDVIKPAFALETAAQQLENSTGGKFKTADAISESRAQGLRHNVSADDALASIKKLIDEGFGGDIEGAKKVNDAVLTISKSRGIDAIALAKFAASIKGTFKTAKAESISRLLATQIAQGDEGSVTIEQLSALGGRIVAPAAFLAGTDDSRLAQIGAVMQATKSGFGSADELATGVSNLITHFATTGDQLQKELFQVQDKGKDKGKVADLGTVIANVYRLTGGDASKMTSQLGIGATSPEMKAILSQKEIYTQAGGGEAGAKAIADNIDAFQQMTSTLETEREGERKVLQTSGEKWTATIEGLKNKLLDVMPEVQKFVDQFAKIAPQFGGALVTLAKIMIKVANYLAGLFGEEAVNENTATGETRGEYKINPTTGQFEFVKQSELNAQKANDIFDPLNYKGEGLKLNISEKKPSDTNAESNASTAANVSSAPGSILSPLLPTSQPMSISLPGISSAPTSSAPNTAAGDDALASLDALAPKAKNLGLMFDKLAVAGNDAARTKPLSQR